VIKGRAYSQPVSIFRQNEFIERRRDIRLVVVLGDLRVACWGEEQVEATALLFDSSAKSRRHFNIAEVAIHRVGLQKGRELLTELRLEAIERNHLKNACDCSGTVYDDLAKVLRTICVNLKGAVRVSTFPSSS
jgi:hypothetical protein